MVPVALDDLLPAFAPLPYPMLQQILTNRRRDTLLRVNKRNPKTIEIEPTNPLEEESGFKQEEWDALLDDIRPIRQAVFTEMDPVVRQGRLTTAWLSQALLAATPKRNSEQKEQAMRPKRQRRERDRVPRTTLSSWQERGLVEFEGRNYPDPDVSAALLIARRAETRRLRNWLPPKISLSIGKVLDAQSQEALDDVLDSLSMQTWLTCWRQDPPEEPGAQPSDPVACPVPLPAGLNKATLLVSPWQGFQWKPSWRRRINSLGIGRWYGAGEDGWDVSLDDLSMWIRETERFALPDMETRAPDVFQNLADVVLNRVGYTLLSRLQ